MVHKYISAVSVANVETKISLHRDSYDRMFGDCHALVQKMDERYRIN